MAFSFGGTTASAAPSFGFGSTATPAFGTSAPSFAAMTSVPPPGFGATTATPSFGAATGFGSTFGATSSAPSLGFGATSAAPSFGFGSSTFGAKPTASTGFGTSSLFGGGSTLFGAPQPTATSAFSGGFGSQPQPAFGAPTATAFGQPAAQAQPTQQPTSSLDAQYNAVLFCNIYGDERDAILSKWNALQACWGTGKGYYSSTATPVEFKPDGPFCRFKSVGYIPIPETKDDEGLVAMLIQKKAADVSQNQAGLVATLQQALGNRQGLVVNVVSVNATGEAKCEVVLTVEEKTAVGASQKAAATALANHLWGQPAIKALLESQGVSNCYPRSKPSEAQIKEYLDTPPGGIDVRLWRQAVANNPDTSRYVPVPIIGFESLAGRSKSIQAETERQGKKLDEFSGDLATMQRSIAESSATINQMKMSQLDVQHRLLKVLIRQECARRSGSGLASEEEKLGSRLESIGREMSLPAQFRGKLNELLSQLRLRTRVEQHSVEPKVSLDPDAVAELKLIIMEEQKGMKELLDIINEDFAILKSLESVVGQRS